MSLSRIIVRQAVSQARSGASPRANGGSGAAPRAIAALLAAWLAWYAAEGSITPRSGLGYALGVVGGSMMLVLMLYPVRKYFARLRRWLSLKYWLSLHVVCGIAGPLLVVFHSGFRLRSVNATVAMVTMLLVVASGIVGRYLYRQVHKGAGEAQAAAGKKRETFDAEVARHVAGAGVIVGEVDRFAQLASTPPPAWRARARHFLRIETGRLLARYRVRSAVARMSSCPERHSALQRAAFEAIAAIQSAAQFAAYERLFSLWRIVHVPFVLVMLVSAIVHVIAVHAY